MVKVIIIEKNKNGKIELTKEELQKMLDEVYTQGCSDGKRSMIPTTYPSCPWTVTCDSTTMPLDKVTIKGSSEC